MKITAEFNSNEELISFINTFGTKVVDQVTEEARVEPVTKKKASKKDKTEEPIKTFTKDDVQAACKIKIKQGKQAQVKEIIAAHGASNISGLAEEEYEAVIAEVEAL